MDEEKKEGEEDEGEHIILLSPYDWSTVAEAMQKTESRLKRRSAIDTSLIFFHPAQQTAGRVPASVTMMKTGSGWTFTTRLTKTQEKW